MRGSLRRASKEVPDRESGRGCFVSISEEPKGTLIAANAALTGHFESPTAAGVTIGNAVDAEEGALIDTLTVHPVRTVCAVITWKEHGQKVTFTSAPQSSARNEKAEAASVKKAPRTMVR